MLSFLFRAFVVLRKRRKYRGFRYFYQEPRQLQIQSCIPKADWLDRDDEGEDDDNHDDDDDDDDDDADADFMVLMLLITKMLVSMMITMNMIMQRITIAMTITMMITLTMAMLLPVAVVSCYADFPNRNIQTTDAKLKQNTTITKAFTALPIKKHWKDNKKH